jgi:hypothetical protein
VCKIQTGLKQETKTEIVKYTNKSQQKTQPKQTTPTTSSTKKPTKKQPGKTEQGRSKRLHAAQHHPNAPRNFHLPHETINWAPIPFIQETRGFCYPPNKPPPSLKLHMINQFFNNHNLVIKDTIISKFPD